MFCNVSFLLTDGETTCVPLGSLQLSQSVNASADEMKVASDEQPEMVPSNTKESLPENEVVKSEEISADVQLEAEQTSESATVPAKTSTMSAELSELEDHPTPGSTTENTKSDVKTELVVDHSCPDDTEEDNVDAESAKVVESMVQKVVENECGKKEMTLSKEETVPQTTESQ